MTRSKILAHTFKFIARFLAVLFVILFIVATALVLLLLNFKHTLLNAETYKRALVKNEVYAQVPVLAAEQLSSFKTFLADSCTDHPLGCAIDGASPELRACLIKSLGKEAYLEIGSAQRNPTKVELQLSQPCLDRYATAAPQPGSADEPSVENPLTTASAEVQACARRILGKEIYETLYNGQRSPTKPETRRINACFRQARKTLQSTGFAIGGDLMIFLQDFSVEQWQMLFRYLFPGDGLQHMTESALDQVFSYLNGETDKVKLSLVNLKARLTGQAGQDLILFLLSSQPPCTEEEQAQINADNFENGGLPAIYCAASGDTLAKVLPEMQNRLDEAIAQIPDEVIIISPASALNPSGDLGMLGRDTPSAIRAFHRGLRLSPLLLLSLLLLVTIFGVRSLKGWMRWWGISLFISGFISLCFGIAAQSILDWVWVNFAVPEIPSMLSSSLVEIGHALLRFAVHELAKWTMLEAGLIAALGLAAIIGSFFIKPRQAVPSLTSPEPPSGDVVPALSSDEKDE